MSARHESLISKEEEQALHRRLVAGDATAPADLVQLFLDYLSAWLVKKNARVPEALCLEAAEDALISLIKTPASFKIERGMRLAAYLLMSAQGDLRNILRRERRAQKNQIRLEDVELSAAGGKCLAVDDDPSLPLAMEEDTAWAVKTVIAPAREGLSEAESRALDLILCGERKNARFAEVLGLQHLPIEGQEAAVKRVKDKLKKRIKRLSRGDDKKP
jgi:hypothetical protein